MTLDPKKLEKAYASAAQAVEDFYTAVPEDMLASIATQAAEAALQAYGVPELEARAARVTEERDAAIHEMAKWAGRHGRLQADFDNLKAESEARSAGKLIIVPPVEDAPEVTITIGGLGLVVTDPLAPMFAEEVEKLKATVIEAKDKLRYAVALSNNYWRQQQEIATLKAELARFHAAYDKAKALYDWHRQYKDGHINNRLQYRGAKDVFSCFLFCEPPTPIHPSDSAPAGDVGDTNVVEIGGGDHAS